MQDSLIKDLHAKRADDKAASDNTTAQKVKALQSKVRALRMVDTSAASKKKTARNMPEFQAQARQTPNKPALSNIIGVAMAIFSAAWVLGAGFYFAQHMGAFQSASIYEIAVIAIAVIMPPAISFMVWSAFARKDDVRIYAQALRAELRGLLLPSEGSAQIINNDIAQLCRQASEVSAASRGLLQSLARARQGLRAELRDFSGVSQKAEFHIGRLAETLDLKAKEMDETTALIEGRVDAIEEKAGIIGDKMESASDAAGDVCDRFDGVGARLDAGVSKIDDGAKQIDGAVNEMTGQAESLSNAAHEISQQSAEMSQTLGGLLSDADEIGSKADEICKAGDGASNKLKESLSSAVRGAQDVQDAVYKAVARLDSATSQAGDKTVEFADKIARRIADLARHGIDASEKVEGLLEKLEASKESLGDKVGLIESAGNKISQRAQDGALEISSKGDLLVQAAKSLADIVADPISDLQKAASFVHDKADNVCATLNEGASSVFDAGDKAQQIAQDINSSMVGVTKEMLTLSGEMKENSGALVENIAQQNRASSQGVKMCLDGIAKAGDALCDRSLELEKISSRTLDNVERSKASVVKGWDEMAKSADGTLDRLGVLDAGIASQTSALEAMAGQTVESVDKALLKIKDTTSGLEPICDDAISRARNLQENLAALKDAHANGSKAMLASAREGEQALDERLKSLEALASDANAAMNSVSNILQTHSNTLQDTAQGAVQATKNLAAELQAQETEAHLRADKAALRMDSAAAQISQQFHDFETGSNSAIQNLKVSGKAFSDGAKAMEKGAATAANVLEAMSNKAKIYTNALFEAAQNASLKGLALADDISAKTKDLSNGTAKGLSDLQKSADVFAVHANELLQKINAASTATDGHSKTLEAHAFAISDAAAQSADKILHASEVMKNNIDNITRSGELGNEELRNTCMELENRARHFSSSCAKAVERAKAVAGDFDNQSSILNEASKNARDVAKSVALASTNLRRQEFLGTAKFVVESLHSLSIDVTRMIDGGVDEKIWKDFQNGDTAAFSRRLVRVQEALPMDRAQDKFANDGEFRGYVQRFLRQFEELWATAQSADSDSLLASTFASSDMGRLYHLLCKVAGRGSRLSKFSDGKVI